MLDKELAKDIPIAERGDFLRDNCDAVESVTYSRTYTSEELAKQRETLTEVSIKIADIEEKKKEKAKHFKELLEPLVKERTQCVERLKSKSEVVTEDCYKFYDEETNSIGFYNDDGDLVYSRPAFPNEMQKTIYANLRTGTND